MYNNESPKSRAELRKSNAQFSDLDVFSSLDARQALQPGTVQTINDVISRSFQVVDQNIPAAGHSPIDLNNQTILVLGPSVSTPDIAYAVARKTGNQVIPFTGTRIQATQMNESFSGLKLPVTAMTIADTALLRSEMRKGARIVAFGLKEDSEFLNRLKRQLDNQAELRIASDLNSFGNFFGIENLGDRLRSELRQIWATAAAA